MGLNNGFYSSVYNSNKSAATYLEHTWNRSPIIISDVIWGHNPGRIFVDLEKDFDNIDPKKFRGIFNTKFVKADDVKDIKKVYFLSDSRYPRERLTLAGIKRCLKPENADYIVTPNYSFVHFNAHMLNVWENDSTFIFCSQPMQYGVKKATETMNGLTQDKYTYKGCKQFIDTELSEKWMIDLFATPNTNYITETEFEKVCSRDLPTITQSEVTTIESLLKSNDEGNIILAIKTLYGYNFIEHPLIFTTLLCKYFKNIANSCEYSTKMFRHFKKCIKLENCTQNNICEFPYWLSFLDGQKSFTQPEGEEKEILEHLIRPLYESYINSYRNKIMDWSDHYNFCPEVKLYLDKNNKFDKEK